VIVETLAERGVAALMVANAPAAMAPWGGRRPLFGTDPIAFAAPLGADDPVVVDISLSKVARGKIMAAAQKGDPIPEGWALDPDGHPTTDAKAAMAGTMIPLGDAKGTALALMVELLCAGLTGANYAWQATSFFDDKGDPPGTGQAIIAIDPDAFGPGGSRADGADGANGGGHGRCAAARPQAAADPGGLSCQRYPGGLWLSWASRLSRPSGPDLSAPDVLFCRVRPLAQ
jgi:LDH2 family malate/lactate/ureidoglycolate dehydrogenase